MRDIGIEMEGTEKPKAHFLRNRIEEAIKQNRPRQEILPVLERLVRDAPEHSEDRLFAHRQLAELYLEYHPWRSALHLRQLIKLGIVDDGVYALMGLSQALLGNYHYAVISYRQALERAPHNPWYHHNLGHILDMGLGKSESALSHLRYAHKIESEEDEISASLAHCLARLGRLEEAKTMAERALHNSPLNGHHQALLSWLKEK